MTLSRKTPKTPPADVMVLNVDLFDCAELASDKREERKAPAKVRLFRKGTIETTKGIFKFDDESARSVLSKHKEYGNDLPFDYDHAMVGFFKLDPAESGKAAGWFVPEVIDGELWASSIKWTPKAEKALLDREWRYVSPYFRFDKDSRVIEVMNAALTNMPATKRMDAIMASVGAELSHEEESPMLPKFLIAMLSLPENADEEAVRAALSQLRENEKALLAITGAKSAVEAIGAVQSLKAEADKVPALAAKLNEFEVTISKAKVDSLVDQGMKAGKITPALKEWATALGTKDFAQLESFLSAAAPVAGVATPGGAKVPSDAIAALSAADQSIAERLGVDPKQVAEVKQQLGTPV